MHRGNLIIRRFGALDFGIGYYDDGVWVDHAHDSAERSGAAPMDTVHDWLACCHPADSEPIPIGETVLAEPRLHVAAR
jgi:hypothetical protein